MTTRNEVAVNGGGKQYGTKLTVLGEATIAANLLAGTKLDVVEIAAGDGGGGYYEPSAEQTALVREVWRAEIAAYAVNPLNPKMLDIKGVIPSADGGFTVRELGVFDRAGTLIGVCNTPDMEKARPDSGAGGTSWMACPGRFRSLTKTGTWRHRTSPAPLFSPSRRRIGGLPPPGYRRNPRLTTGPLAMKSPSPPRPTGAKTAISASTYSIRWTVSTSPTPGRPSAPARTMTGKPGPSSCPAATPIPGRFYL